MSGKYRSLKEEKTENKERVYGKREVKDYSSPLIYSCILNFIVLLHLENLGRQTSIQLLSNFYVLFIFLFVCVQDLVMCPVHLWLFASCINAR